MRSWSFIPAFFALVLLFATQCRAQCLVVPHVAKQPAQECPLHKSKAPAEAKCSHAPQWDVDDTRTLEFVLPAETPVFVLHVEVARTPEAPALAQERATIPIVLRL